MCALCARARRASVRVRDACSCSDLASENARLAAENEDLRGQLARVIAAGEAVAMRAVAAQVGSRMRYLAENIHSGMQEGELRALEAENARLSAEVADLRRDLRFAVSHVACRGAFVALRCAYWGACSLASWRDTRLAASFVASLSAWGLSCALTVSFGRRGTPMTRVNVGRSGPDIAAP